MAWSLQGAENMAAMRVAVANGESIRKQYLAMQASILFPVEIKEAVQEKLKRLPKRKLLGVENIDNVPLLRGGHNLTRMALKRLIEHNAVV
jgi:predicted DNA-binding helix-hairpin-helix protein